MRQFLFSAVFVIIISTNVFAYSGGSGTVNDPYQIATKADFLALAANTGDYGKCFILTVDVNLEGQVFTTAILAADTDSDIGRVRGYPNSLVRLCSKKDRRR